MIMFLNLYKVEFILITTIIGVSGGQGLKCYQCLQCQYGCQVNTTNLGDKEVAKNQEETTEEMNEEGELEEVETAVGPVDCCTGPKSPLPLCQECKLCPETGCDGMTGECCPGPEDVDGGCSPCAECGQCTPGSTTCCPATKDCMMKKSVGGVGYTLSYTGAVLPGCLDDCVYHKDGEPNTRFCFERGNLTVSYKEGRNPLAISHPINKKRGSWNKYFEGYWGDWGDMEYCPPGDFVFGFRVQCEPYQGLWMRGDDTRINSISMRCRHGASRGITKYIRSRRGFWGDWSSSKYCSEDYNVVGFKIYYLPKQGSSWWDDDQSVTAIAMICGNGEILESTGVYRPKRRSKEVRCPKGYAVAGVQTQIEEKQGSGDDTALNGLGIHCRKY